MGQLDDFSLDQMAGASALIISSIGGLLLIIFKSKCKTISCCWGMWNCVRDVNADDSDEEKQKQGSSVDKKDKKEGELEYIAGGIP